MILIIGILIGTWILQITDFISNIFNERKFETFLSTTQFNDSKEGRILALLFWNLIPVLPILYLFIKVIVLIAIEEKLFEDLNRNIIRIKNQIKGNSK